MADLSPHDLSPVTAMGLWMIRFGREVSDCVNAGVCVHDHMPDVCGLTYEERDR